MRNENLGIPILSSVAIHICVILIGSIVFHSNHLRQRDFLPIGLVDLPRPEPPPLVKKIEAPPETKKPVPLPAKAEKPKPVVKQESRPAAKVDVPRPEPPAPPTPTKETVETKAPALVKTETAPSLASGARVEGGGSEAGADNLFGRGDFDVVPGAGSAGGGGGTASSGLGRGSGAPGLPEGTAPVKTNRQAKPIQTVRASYPPTALRAGLESEVTLKIEVDAQGTVTKAEITNSGGSGFDEEALKAVRQSRFEPAQRDGQSVAAEFTYIYRFRLAK